MSLAALLLFGLYAMIFVRTVERGCMIDHVLPKDLVEGDWIVKDIKIDGKHIVGPKDLGIHEIQITRLCEAYDLGKIKKIAVKVGMPLVPAFLVGLIITMTIGNLFFAMIL